jgi:hypothetical protein
MKSYKYFEKNSELTNMKTMFKFLTIIFCATLFTSCSKKDVSTLTDEQQVVKWLTGDGNRYWRLRHLYINDVEQVLTANQLQYNKTYTLTPGQTDQGTFTNVDGLNGTWTLNSKKLIREKIITTTGAVELFMTIIKISETALEIEYIINNTSAREVYYAY